jgi:hypothetical protein
MQNFCTEGAITNPKCYKLETIKFKSEEGIFDIVLDLLKSELPGRMAEVMDCSDKPMYIAEENIDIIPASNEPHFELVLNPLSDLPKYTENRIFRTVNYNFELILTVHNENPNCLTWELLRFKNVVEELMLAVEFVIDGYNAVDVEQGGFNYYVPENSEQSAVYRRQGTYRFTVTISQQEIN